MSTNIGSTEIFEASTLKLFINLVFIFSDTARMQSALLIPLTYPEYLKKFFSDPFLNFLERKSVCI